MVTKTRPVRLWHLIIVALLLAVVITLWSAEFYVEKYPGYEERGFLIPWKTIYGGVDIRYNYSAFVFCLALWWAIFLVVILILFRLIGWKPT